MKDKPLTSRQLEILNFIKAYIGKWTIPPSLREISKAVGLVSISTVHSHLLSLARKGFIRHDKFKPRYIEVIKDFDQKKLLTLPVLSQVVLNPDGSLKKIYQDSLTLPIELADEPEAFVYRNSGESMKEAAILDGDWLIVKSQERAENGEIILAFLQTELTVKRYYQSGGLIKLEPENHRMKPIFVRKLQILGKVVGVMRKLANSQ